MFEGYNSKERDKKKFKNEETRGKYNQIELSPE